MPRSGSSGSESLPARPFVDRSAMPDHDDQDDERGLPDLVHDPVVAHAVRPEGEELPGQALTEPGILGEPLGGLSYAAGHYARQRPNVLFGSGQVEQPVRHRSSTPARAAERFPPPIRGGLSRPASSRRDPRVCPAFREGSPTRPPTPERRPGYRFA